MDPTTILIGAIAALLGSLAFLLRAARPYAEALGRRAADDSRDLDRCRSDREALTRRVQILESRINDRPDV